MASFVGAGFTSSSYNRRAASAARGARTQAASQRWTSSPSKWSLGRHKETSELGAYQTRALRDHVD
jgi:hypothetical protein